MFSENPRSDLNLRAAHRGWRKLVDLLRQWKLYRCEASGPGVSDDLADLARAEAISGVREARGDGVLVLGPLMLIIECDLRQQSRGWSNAVLGVRESLEQFQFFTFSTY